MKIEIPLEDQFLKYLKCFEHVPKALQELFYIFCHSFLCTTTLQRNLEISYFGSYPTVHWIFILINPILITVLQIWFKTFHLYSGNCTNWYYVGDNFCDDSNNNLQCHFDGGDCCLFNQVDLTYCTDCYCLYGKARPRYIYQRDKSISYYMYVMNKFFDSILHVLNKIFLETTC